MGEMHNEMAQRAWGHVDKARPEDLYRQHAPKGLRLAYLLTGDHDVAHDLVQDAFVRILGRPRMLQRDDAFDAYLRATIVNLSRSRFRRLALERRQAPKPEVAPEAMSHEDKDEVRRALLALPERQRAALVLRYFEDLSEREAADAMQTTVAAIKSLVQRATKTMRTVLEGERDD